VLVYLRNYSDGGGGGGSGGSQVDVVTFEVKFFTIFPEGFDRSINKSQYFIICEGIKISL
jgi:hypothetical protein